MGQDREEGIGRAQNTFEKLMRAHGYGRENREKPIFVRNEDGVGIHFVELNWIRHMRECDVVVYLGGSIDSVEDVKKRYGENAEDGPAITFVTELGELLGEPHWRWSISSAEAVEGTIDAMMDSIVTVGIPFLKNYTSVERLYGAIVADPFGAEAMRICTPSRIRMWTGVTLAFLKAGSVGVMEFSEKVAKRVRRLTDKDRTAFAAYTANLLAAAG